MNRRRTVPSPGGVGCEPTASGLLAGSGFDPGMGDRGTPVAGPAQRFAVLVVEDDPMMRLFYGLALADARNGTDVHYAVDGWQGLVLASEVKPGLILCDLNTPRIDGFGFLDALPAACPDLGAAEVIAVTALTREDIDARGGLPEGVQVLHKPLSMRAVSRVVQIAKERYLHGARAS